MQVLCYFVAMRYLIVGLGNIGQKRKAVLGKKCVCTVDPNPNQKANYLDYRKAPFNIFDVAVLTIPQHLKYDLTEYFLRRGKHVLVEKPLIISRNQGKKLADLAKKNKVIWHTSYNHRFEPNLVKLKKLLKKNIVGKLYHARFVYSFGNITDRIGTWRETQFGVIEEVAPHLIDFIINSLGYKGEDFETLIARKVESNIFDHWLISAVDRKIILEVSSITWKNIFSIEIYGKLGSVHLNGLCKWNGSELIIRKRVLPSGIPKEKRLFDAGADLTWKDDFLDFEKSVKEYKTSLKNDLQISLALAKIALGAKDQLKNKQNKIYQQILKES